MTASMVAAVSLASSPGVADTPIAYSYIVIDNRDRAASLDLMNAISFGLPAKLRSRIASLGRFDQTPRLEVQFRGACEEAVSLITAVTVLVRKSSDAPVRCDRSPPTERAPYPR